MPGLGRRLIRRRFRAARVVERRVGRQPGLGRQRAGQGVADERDVAPGFLAGASQQPQRDRARGRSRPPGRDDDHALGIGRAHAPDDAS